MAPDARYPALLLDWLTPVYDLFARLSMPETQFKRDLIAHAQLAPGQRVLDLGTGTGTLAILIKQNKPEAQVIGLDGDLKILSIAREKAARADVTITFVPGNVVALPYSDHSFDRILSTLVLSVLSREEKQLTLREAYRVLIGGGELHIADFGPPHTAWGRLVSPLVRRFEPISGNLDGLLPVICREAGFEDITDGGHYSTLFGTISILSGRKPGFRKGGRIAGAYRNR